MKPLKSFLLPLLLLLPVSAVVAQFPDPFDLGPPFPPVPEDFQLLLQDKEWPRLEDKRWPVQKGSAETVPGQLIVLVEPMVPDKVAKDLFLHLGYLILEEKLLPDPSISFGFPKRLSEIYDVPWYRISVGQDSIEEIQRLLKQEIVKDVKYVYRKGWRS